VNDYTLCTTSVRSMVHVSLSKSGRLYCDDLVLPVDGVVIIFLPSLLTEVSSPHRTVGTDNER